MMARRSRLERPWALPRCCRWTIRRKPSSGLTAPCTGARRRGGPRLRWGDAAPRDQRFVGAGNPRRSSPKSRFLAPAQCAAFAGRMGSTIGRPIVIYTLRRFFLMLKQHYARGLALLAVAGSLLA